MNFGKPYFAKGGLEGKFIKLTALAYSCIEEKTKP
jgi:hypothetical protein